MQEVLQRELKDEEAFFFEKVRLTTGCWFWQAAVTHNGYGRVQIGRKTLRAHRHVWTLFRGAIPKGLQVLHSCDNPRCVRPDHLFLGTGTANMADRDKKKRQASGARNGRAKVTEADVANIRQAYAGGETQVSIAQRYGLRQGHVSNIILGRFWKKS